MGRRQHPFARVDDQPDPQAWIGVLDRLRTDPLYARYKARVAELLDPAPGRRYLEIGAGTGADAIELTRRYGVEVIGVDSSDAMVEEARRRGLAEALAADAHALPFEADEFDGAWADRTFQHLADPGQALSEMARVVRPGGLILVADPDYGTQVVNIADQDLAERVLAFRAGVGNWRLGHQMPRLFAAVGLADVRAEAVPIVVTEPSALDNALGLRSWAGLAADQGIVASADVAAWEGALDEAAAGGWFLYAFCIFLTTGRVGPVDPDRAYGRARSRESNGLEQVDIDATGTSHVHPTPVRGSDASQHSARHHRGRCRGLRAGRFGHDHRPAGLGSGGP